MATTAAQLAQMISNLYDLGYSVRSLSRLGGVSEAWIRARRLAEVEPRGEARVKNFVKLYEKLAPNMPVSATPSTGLTPAELAGRPRGASAKWDVIVEYAANAAREIVAEQAQINAGNAYSNPLVMLPGRLAKQISLRSGYYVTPCETSRWMREHGFKPHAFVGRSMYWCAPIGYLKAPASTVAAVEKPAPCVAASTQSTQAREESGSVEHWLENVRAANRLLQDSLEGLRRAMERQA